MRFKYTATHISGRSGLVGVHTPQGFESFVGPRLCLSEKLQLAPIWIWRSSRILRPAPLGRGGRRTPTEVPTNAQCGSYSLI